jgi:hypothetical protein
MVEYKTIITYQEASESSIGQKNAFPCPVVSKPTLRPSPQIESIIMCRAAVAFQPITDLGPEVAGIPTPVSAECIMSPNPECKGCKVKQLETKLGIGAKFVSKKKYEKHGPGVFLAEAGIDIEPARWG